MSARAYVSFAEVKERISIVDALQVFGVSQQFQTVGKTVSGVCPLPAHKHGPSPNPNQFKITIRDGVSVFHCFGDCQRGGDVIEFVKLMTGLDHQHVRFWFAEHFGDRLTLKRSRGEGRPARESPAEIKEAGEVVQKPRPAGVKSNDSKVSGAEREYKPIRFRLQVDPTAAYLRERGLSDETIERYGLGLAKRGMLAGYIAIPVWDHPKGEYPAAYLGRWPGDDYDEQTGRPRYKWPATFPKQRFLFGLNEALEGTDGKPIIVVEGVFGTLHCVQNGFQSTVAAFGSSLSDEQAKLLIETGRPIVLMFDGGEPGRRGMRKAVLKLSRKAFVRAVRLRPDQQPDHLKPMELRKTLHFIQ